MTIAAKHDLTIEQSATFRALIQWLQANGQPVDLSGGWTASLQVRARYADMVVLLQMDTTTGGITIDASTSGPTMGVIHLFASAAITAALSWSQGLYDLVLISPQGDEVRLLSGTVTVSPAVTR